MAKTPILEGFRCPSGHVVRIVVPRGKGIGDRFRVWCPRCDMDYRYSVPVPAGSMFETEYGGDDDAAA